MNESLNKTADDNYVSASGLSENSQSYQSDLEKDLWRRHNLRVLVHSLIPVYGLAVILVQFS